MFLGARYATRGIQDQIPQYLQNILWYLIETMQVAEYDHLQVFELSPSSENWIVKQKIIHSQETPEYRKEYTITLKEPVNAKIFVVDEHHRCMMLLASEY
jgi:hypothetical protein